MIKYTFLRYGELEPVIQKGYTDEYKSLHQPPAKKRAKDFEMRQIFEELTIINNVHATYLLNGEKMGETIPNLEIELKGYGTWLHVKSSDCNIQLGADGSLCVVSHTGKFPIYFDGKMFRSNIFDIMVTNDFEFILTIKSVF